MTSETLVLGLGNVLLADEAAGPETVRRLGQGSDPLGPILYLDGGTLSFSLAIPIADCVRLIVVDAAVMGDPPGTVRTFEGQEMDRRLARHAGSVHEVSLSDLMDMARLTGSLPEHRALVGIEPRRVEWGDGLSPEVELAVELAMVRVREILARWDEEDGQIESSGPGART